MIFKWPEYKSRIFSAIVTTDDSKPSWAVRDVAKDVSIRAKVSEDGGRSITKIHVK